MTDMDPISVPNGSRVRRRDGKIVKNSSSVYHLYKLSRRTLKRERIYYLSHYEDTPHFDPSLVEHWLQVRHYQSNWLLQRLVDSKFVSTEVAAKVQSNLESIEGWISSNRVASESLTFSSAASWVATLTLHHTVEPISKEFAFEGQDFVDRFDPCRLWEIFEDVPDSSKRDGVVVLPLKEVRKQSRLEENFHTLLRCVRNSDMPGIHAHELPEVMNGIASLQPPRRIVFTQFGKQYL